MGIGDDLMALGEARVLHNQTGLPVAIGDGKRIWTSSVFAEVPFLAQPGAIHRVSVAWLANYPGNRPYINYEATRELGREVLRLKGATSDEPRMLLKAAGRWLFNKYEPIPAEVMLSKKVRIKAKRLRMELGPYVVIEPHIKRKAPPGKEWGWDKYEEVARTLSKDIRLVQVGQPGLQKLPKVHYHATNSMLEAIAVLGRAVGYIGPEGGLHHGAAAVNTPGVVIYGGYVSPDVTGYARHHTMYSPEGSPCGSRGHCGHCVRAMGGITPSDVIDAVRAHLLTPTDVHLSAPHSN